MEGGRLRELAAHGSSTVVRLHKVSVIFLGSINTLRLHLSILIMFTIFLPILMILHFTLIL